VFAPPSTAAVDWGFSPGTWRSLAELKPANQAQLAAVVRRFGPLTRDGYGAEGEPLDVWQALVLDLQPMAGAWTEEGQAGNAVAIGAAGVAAYELQDRLGADHLARDGQFRPFPQSLHWAMVCLDMAQWWRSIAIRHVCSLPGFRRCRYCGAWFSLEEQRSDASFCGRRHRDAFHYQKQAATGFWAEVI
jgi:hypothetical protein